MKSRSRNRSHLRVYSIISVITLSAVLLIPSLSLGAGTGVGVFNSPPTFVGLSIIDHVDRVGIYVSISDYNGWDDVASVNVRIVDAKDRLISNMTYYQYNAAGVRVDSFVDNLGDYLIPPDTNHPSTTSSVQRFKGVGWFEDNTTQKMVFMVQPLNGAIINITAYDRDGASCSFEGPFSAQYSEPPIINNITIAVGISLIIAAAVSSYLFYGRRLSNSMARKIEKILSQVYEE